MATIDSKAIEKKVKAYVSSRAGKEKIDATMRSRASSRFYSNYVTEDVALMLAKELANDIVKAAQSYGIPASVSSAVASLAPGEIRTQMGRSTTASYTVGLYFEDNLYRPSLRPSKYGGVDNIIAVFNNGYPHNGTSPDRIAHVRGKWHGKNVFALGSRPQLNFIQEGVSKFISDFGWKYDVQVDISGEYNA